MRSRPGEVWSGTCRTRHDPRERGSGIDMYSPVVVVVVVKFAVAPFAMGTRVDEKETLLRNALHHRVIVARVRHGRVVDCNHLEHKDT